MSLKVKGHIEWVTDRLPGVFMDAEFLQQHFYLFLIELK